MIRKYIGITVCSLISAMISALVTWLVLRVPSANIAVDSKTAVEYKVESNGRFPFQHTLPTQIRSNSDRPRPSAEKLTMRSTTDQSNPLRTAVDVAESSGDFSSLHAAFDSLSQKERMRAIQEVSTIFTRMGPKYDLAEKMVLLEKVNAPASTLETFKRKMLEMEARERYDAMKVEGVLSDLQDQEFGVVCRALAASRLKRGFQAIEDGKTESAKRMAASMVAKYSIQSGTMEASEEIGALPPGIARDEAVAEMVLWLKRTGAEQEAAPWLETIVDVEAKMRATGK